MGFVSSIFGANNDFNAQQANLDNTDYGAALQKALGDTGLNTGLVDNTNADATRTMQNQFAQALMQQMQGGGPSVAQQQLNQTLDANNKAAAAQIGSARGVNPALQARMVAQGTAANNQAAAGQGALLRAQEQLNAQGMLGTTLGNQRQQDISQAQGNVATGLQAQANNLNRLGTIGGLQNTQNANRISNLANAQGINSSVSAQNANTNGQIGGGILSGIASAASMGGGGKWQGGPVGYADGGQVAPILAVQSFIPKNNPWATAFLMQKAKQNGGGMPQMPMNGGVQGPSGTTTGDMPVNKYSLGVNTDMPGASPTPTPNEYSLGADTSMPGAAMPTDTSGPALGVDTSMPTASMPQFFDDGGSVAPIEGMQNFTGGGNPWAGAFQFGNGGSNVMGQGKSMAPMLAMMAARGGSVPGRAAVPGNSPANDTVPTMLSPGEVVLPRTVVNAKDAGQRAKEFVEHVKRKQNADGKGYGAILEAHRKLKEATAHLEKLCMGGRV